MKDFLVDIVAHTQALGVIDLVKIIGDANNTFLETVSSDKSLIVKAKFNQANPEFEGVFGMPDLSNLATILNVPEYKENSQINVMKMMRNGVDTPVGLHFENQTGDFKNDYRFMVTEVVNEKLKSTKFKGVTWNITMEPTISNIARLKYQAQANSGETLFTTRTEGSNLKFFFGDQSTHAGEFIFQSGVQGQLTHGWSYPISIFLAILNLAGDKVIQFSDEGVIQVTVDSGLIKYEYLLPAQQK
jgi:hypothetical protein